MNTKKNIALSILCLPLVLFAQNTAKKPSIMIFPADVWMTQNNYAIEVDNQGVKTTIYDYSKALSSNPQLYAVINKIEGMYAERGYKLDNLSSKMKEIAEQAALDNVDINQQGGSIAESARDKILKTAKPDIVLELTWTVTTTGPKKSLDFQLKAVDAGTRKAIASAGGATEPSFISEVPLLLEKAVLDHLDNFNYQLQTYFEDMVANGREISLNIKVWDTSPKKLNDEINDDGDLLKDDLKKWVSKNTVKGVNKLTYSSGNEMRFSQVRIPLFDTEGVAFDADGFASNLRKYIRKTYQIVSESGTVGTGTAEVVIGGKR